MVPLCGDTEGRPWSPGGISADHLWGWESWPRPGTLPGSSAWLSFTLPLCGQPSSHRLFRVCPKSPKPCHPPLSSGIWRVQGRAGPGTHLDHDPERPHQGPPVASGTSRPQPASKMKLPSPYLQERSSGPPQPPTASGAQGSLRPYKPLPQTEAYYRWTSAVGGCPHGQARVEGVPGSLSCLPRAPRGWARAQEGAGGFPSMRSRKERKKSQGLPGI